MLHDELENLDCNKILRTLEKDGAIQLTNFLSKEVVSSILNDFEVPASQTLNNNSSGLIYYQYQNEYGHSNQKFISQILVHSKSIFDFLTSDKLQDLFESSLKGCTLKSSRFYQTGSGEISIWHHDEKNSGYSSSGLIILIYLSDVISIKDGPFQYINGTHTINYEMPDKDFSAENINKKFSQNIVTCFGKSGTIIIANSKTIHRAMPHEGKNYRTSLFTQISKLEEKTFRERILVNPAFLEDKILKSERLKQFLGFGISNSNHIFPDSNIDNLPFNKEIIFILTHWLAKKISKKIFESLPLFIKIIIRKKILQRRNVIPL